MGYIDELLKSKSAKATTASTNSAIKIFTDFRREKGENLSVDNKEDLNILLGQFYASVRNTNGDDYKTSTLTTLKIWFVSPFYDAKQYRHSL